MGIAVRHPEPFHGVEPVLLDPLGVRVRGQGRPGVGGERGDQRARHRARGSVEIESHGVFGVQRGGVDAYPRTTWRRTTWGSGTSTRSSSELLRPTRHRSRHRSVTRRAVIGRSWRRSRRTRRRRDRSRRRERAFVGAPPDAFALRRTARAASNALTTRSHGIRCTAGRSALTSAAPAAMSATV